MENFTLPTKNTWCPGCGNFPIQRALQQTVESINKDKTVLVTGIGCHGKIADYVNMNSFYSLHGRAIPTATGIKLANEDLDVIVAVGDGDAYNEGMAHLIHAARRNSDITVVVHDNHVFSLTVKQATATSPRGFVTTTAPKGNTDDPINPLQLMLSAGATFIARGYAGEIAQLSDIILQAVRHKGFSFVEILQPCVAWYNTYPDYNNRVYKMDEECTSLEQTKEKIQEWDYVNSNRIPLGIFYRQQKLTFEEQLEPVGTPDISSFIEESK